jgi:5-methylthioribose kinase
VTNLKTQFETQFPHARYIGAQHLEAIKPLLQAHGLLGPNEVITATEKPGEGNMNFVLRVITTHRSVILKQSRPWVEKYPHVAAPVERLQAEAAYYQLTATEPSLRAMSPALLAADLDQLVLLFEDLGAGSDYTFSYAQGACLSRSEIETIFGYLAKLHGAFINADTTQFPSNHALKKLNHEHIFNYPFNAQNGFDLDSIQPGLAALATPIIQDYSLRERLNYLGHLYLGSGPVLIHGDFYPGSWLRTSTGLKIIDPEFAHFGHAEFDLGVLLAHLFMTRTPFDLINQGLQFYRETSSLDDALATEFCGVEILRRLLGLAQLPVDLSLTEKRDLIALAKSFVSTPTTTPFS